MTSITIEWYDCLWEERIDFVLISARCAPSSKVFWCILANQFVRLYAHLVNAFCATDCFIGQRPQLMSITFKELLCGLYLILADWIILLRDYGDCVFGRNRSARLSWLWRLCKIQFELVGQKLYASMQFNPQQSMAYNYFSGNRARFVIRL